MIQSITGTKDNFSPEIKLWQHIEETARVHFALFQFEEIRTPLLEVTELFARGIGTETGVVKKEMYTFDDKGGESVTLRPEGTASVVRAYIEHNFERADPVTKLYYMGPMFRYERPQKGRLRQFHQIGAEIFGTKTPQTDVEIIVLADSFVRKLGLTDFELQINSLGCTQQAGKCRSQYQEELKKYLSKHGTEYCEDCQRRITTNPLRVFDCKNQSCQKLFHKAPEIFSYLCENCEPHFESVKNGLSLLKVPFVINARIARGLDYYDQTAFEFISNNLGAQNAFGGGGRYNGLVKHLGGQDIPAVGFALGVERLVLLLEGKTPPPPSTKVYVMFLGREAWPKAIEIAHSLRQNGIACEIDFEEKSFKAQFRRADKLGCTHAVILGENEVKEGKVQVKDMAKKTQMEIPFNTLVDHLKNGPATI